MDFASSTHLQSCNCKQKGMAEMMKAKAKLLQFKHMLRRWN